MQTELRFVGLGGSKHYRTALAALSIVLSALLALPSYAQQRAALVVVDPVVHEPLSQTQPVQGRFVATQAGAIAAQTRGALIEMHVNVGDRVVKGEPLATLDTERLRAEFKRRQAAVAHRTAQLEGSKTRHEQAQSELNRLRRLRSSAAFNQARYDDKVNQVASTRLQIAEFKAVLQTAEADLALAKLNLDRSAIVAPFDGVVSRRYIQPGAYVTIGNPVVELIDDSSLEIEADVPSSRLIGLSLGAIVQVATAQGRQWKAEVRAMIPQENALSRTRAVRFKPLFDPRDVDAAAGAAVTVRVPIGRRRDVLTVHKDAVIQQGGAFVYVVEEGKASRKRVVLGEPTENRFVVSEGLEEGMQAIIRGNERLRPDQPVMTGDGPEQPASMADKPESTIPADERDVKPAERTGKKTGEQAEETRS